MKSKILIFLFALPFFGVGVWMSWSIATTFAESWAMEDWIAVEAQLLDAGYESHSGDDSTTYEAYARYRYQLNGREFAGDRVAISSGADNIGSFQQDAGNRLAQAMRNGNSIIVYVNPENAAESIVYREVRWGLLGFKLIFALVFGGVGLGLIVYSFVARKKDSADALHSTGDPWLQNEDWQTPVIRSSSKTSMYAAWGFAAFWNLISAPLPFVIYSEVLDKGNKLALVGLLFPLVGLGLIKWALARTLEWRRFGPVPVTLDPFPGSIGGHVGGTLDLRLPYDEHHKFTLNLTCIHSYISGSGKDRSRRESAKWQDQLVAHAERGPDGNTRLAFRFDVPDALAESDATKNGDSYDLWRLNLSAELPGADLDRDYEIPVYATRATSRSLPHFSMERARAAQNVINDESVKEVINLVRGATGSSMRFPMARHLGAGLMGTVFGAIFAGIGWFLLVEEQHYFMGGIFGLIGGIIAISSLYMIFNSLEVAQDGMYIKTVRRIAGIVVSRKRMRRQDVASIEKKSGMQMQSGGRHTVYYSVYAHDRNGNRLLLGDGFKGASTADAAIRLLSTEFGLGHLQRSTRRDDTGNEPNFLAADT